MTPGIEITTDRIINQKLRIICIWQQFLHCLFSMLLLSMSIVYGADLSISRFQYFGFVFDVPKLSNNWPIFLF